jgi:hypothetical protein
MSAAKMASGFDVRFKEGGPVFRAAFFIGKKMERETG